MRIIADIFAYTSQKMPKFNSISISGYHMQEAGATADLELAYTLADGIEYVRAGIAAGIDVDAFAPRLSFFWAIGMNFFMEVAKLRAARLLWAQAHAGTSAPKNPKSMSPAHALARPAAGPSPRRTCTTTSCAPAIEAMAAAQGHTQSLHTNSLDEALALPTDFSARIARNTQLFIQQETGTTRVIDPWGGSYYVERLTYDLAEQGLGAHPGGRGSSAAWPRRSRQGLPKLRIEEAAARTQARIDAGRQTMVGVNKYQRERRSADRGAEGRQHGGARAPDREAGAAARPSAIRREVEAALHALTQARAPAAATCWSSRWRRRAPRRPSARSPTRWKRCYGRHRGRDPGHFRRLPPGESGRWIRTGDGASSLLCEDFEKNDGRRPRILVAKMGQDGHDRGQKVIAIGASPTWASTWTSAPLFQTPAEAARQAVENDVHVVGVSLAGGGASDAGAGAEGRAGEAGPRRTS